MVKALQPVMHRSEVCITMSARRTRRKNSEKIFSRNTPGASLVCHLLDDYGEEAFYPTRFLFLFSFRSFRLSANETGPRERQFFGVFRTRYLLPFFLSPPGGLTVSFFFSFFICPPTKTANGYRKKQRNSCLGHRDEKETFHRITCTCTGRKIRFTRALRPYTVVAEVKIAIIIRPGETSERDSETISAPSGAYTSTRSGITRAIETNRSERLVEEIIGRDNS